MLRLPRHMPRHDKLRRVEAVTTALGLRTCQDTIIGAGRGQLGGLLHRCMWPGSSWIGCIRRGPKPANRRVLLSAGGFFRKGVSGGERKRTSIAVELLIDPSVLLLVRRCCRRPCCLLAVSCCLLAVCLPGALLAWQGRALWVDASQEPRVPAWNAGV